MTSSKAMREPDYTSIIPRARAHYGSDRWREVRGLPAAPAAVEADLTSGQRRAFQRLIEILDEPMIGQVHHEPPAFFRLETQPITDRAAMCVSVNALAVGRDSRVGLRSYARPRC
jgi:hypothetical protein